MQVDVEPTVAALSAAFEGTEAAALRERLGALVERALDEGKTSADLSVLLTDWLSSFPKRRARFRTADDALGDLAAWLGATNTIGRAVRGLTRALLDHYALVLTGLAGLATAFYGSAYAAFYRSLDSSPEQVGFTASQVLVRSALGGVLCVAIFGALFFLLCAPYVPPAQALDAPARRYGNRGLLGKQVLLGLACLAGLMVLFFLTDELEWESIAVFLVLGVLIPTALSLRYQRGQGPRVAPLPFKSTAFAATGLGCLAVALVLLGLVTFATAGEEAERVRNGERVDSIDLLGIPILPLGARPASLTWQTGSRADVPLPDCVVYLGHADGTATVYDPYRRRTLQLPEDDVVITVRRDRTSCSAPTNTGPPRIVPGPGDLLRCMHGRWRSPSEERPTYTYSWLAGPWTVDSEAGSVFRPPRFLEPSSLRCAVEAATDLGRDTAYSPYYFPGDERARPTLPARSRAASRRR